MALARGFQRPTRTSRKRAVSWGVGPNAVDVQNSASNSAVWTNGVVLQNDNEATIVRIRGSFQLNLVLQTALGDGFTGAMGIGIVNSQAFAAGVVSMPTPLMEMDWPGWMWHQMFQLKSITAAEADGSNANAVSYRADIDSKAMRKFGVEEVLFGCIQVVLEGGATAHFNADTRVLFKLP